MKIAQRDDAHQNGNGRRDGKQRAGEDGFAHGGRGDAHLLRARRLALTRKKGRLRYDEYYDRRLARETDR